MEGKNYKNQLYCLIEQYLLGKIEAKVFCNEYYILYNLDYEYNDLSDEEEVIFDELNIIARRYTDETEDLINYPDVYYNENSLKQKILEILPRLST